MTIDEFYSLPEEVRRHELFKCCGCSSWVTQMLNKPRAMDLDEVMDQAKLAWRTSSKADWLEAFSHHPKIGDIESLKEKFASTAQWALGEQESVKAAPQNVIAALAEENRRYEDKFGFIFIVCATGKSSEEMLVALQHRLKNSSTEELQIAAQEQLKITKLRIQKLFTS